MSVPEFADRVALVTGAAGNIGRAVAVDLAGRGADLVLADLTGAEGALAATLQDCRAARDDVAAEIVTFDVRDPAAVGEALSGAAERMGPAQLVVNNAGYQGNFGNVLDYDLDELRVVLDVNAFGVFVVLQAAARCLRDAGIGGSIVNVASMAAHGAPNMPAYSMSKGAVISLTRATAKDLAPHGIRVNSVSPGFIGPGAMWKRQVALQAQTPSRYYADDAATVAAQMIDQVPLRRYGSLDEVAGVVAFLLSDAASYMTGSDLEIAGGA
ncbi:MAG TPA: SDR family oxidoreductase [Acidimicrobiia bacterium]|nr:SDR family oxidoreductase [Acidimicrobiia bacterium]